MALYYVAHRLFAAHDRALGAFVAHQLARRFGQDTVFLPFCDTDEDTLVHPCKGRRLFELDRQRLPHLDAMIAVLHGPSLDDGVCMEIGYAAALAIPVVAITTDFQTYAPTPDSAARSVFSDPLLQNLVSVAVAEPRLGPPPTQAELPGHTDRFEVFLRRNLAPLAAATHSAADTIADTVSAANPRTMPLPPPPPGGRLAYLEPSPYGPSEWIEPAAQLLLSSGWDIHTAGRLRQPAELDTADLSRTDDDWQSLGRSTLAIVDVRGPEAPPGAAAVIGACQATGRPVYAPNPRCWWTFAHGREPNFRNLMIQYGLTGTFQHPDDLPDLINALDSPATVR